MAARPYWSGQIRISLVSFGVTLNNALRRGSQVPLHELDRSSGSRIHHRNVTEDGKEVEREQIVKAYEAEKDEYVILEQDEIDAIKLPSSDTLELVTFTDRSSIALARFERPYFVLPDGKNAEEIYAVMHAALLKSDKAGLGQVAMRGREELCAVLATKKGLMLHTLRYDAELSDEDVFPDLGSVRLKGDYVTLANQLIEKNTHPPQFDKFHDHYHEALLELVHAKQAHRKPRYTAAKSPAKVVNFMDALRKSLGAKEATKEKKTSHRAAPAKKRRA